MEQQQRSLVFTAAVGLIILAIIVGSIYYLVKFIQTRVSSNRQSPQASVETIAQASDNPSNIAGEQTSPAPDQQPTQTQRATSQPTSTPQQPSGEAKGGISTTGDRKVFNGGTFQLSYPKNWGTLTCTNSDNVELDPTNGVDSKVNCNYSVKPVTVLVGDSSGCSGETTKLGEMQVTKSKQSDGGYIKYQWCTKTTPALNITHRVSNGNDPASSKQDFSSQIEEMIGKITFARGS